MMKNLFTFNMNLSFKKNILSGNITNIYTKSFGMYRGNPALSVPYEKERAVYKKEKKEMLKQHTKDFWEEQTKVENLWLQDFMKTQSDKKKKDDAKLRTSIIKNSFKCYQNIVNLIFYILK